MPPSSIMLCKTPRETCGSRDFKKTSRRSKGRECSTTIESVRLAMGGRRSRRGRAFALRPMRKPEPQRGAWRHHIGDFPEREFVFPTIDDRSSGGSDQAAVINQAAAANRDDMIERFVGEFIAPEGDHVKQARADDRAENDPGREVHD